MKQRDGNNRLETPKRSGQGVGDKNHKHSQTPAYSKRGGKCNNIRTGAVICSHTLSRLAMIMPEVDAFP